ncbi:MAG: peptidoglycan editing factor PgeF [bacterium]|nr:peptidoglycan editing factor PgeF [bacterium]
MKKDGIIYGFSTRTFGNLNVKRGRLKDLKVFLKTLGLKNQDLIAMKQVHNDKIVVVGKNDRGRIVEDADSLVTKDPGIFLGVNTADCLPLLFYESQTRIAAAAHGSWQTILKRIAQKTVEKMVNLGANPQNIHLKIGPHIGVCCYDVGSERAAFFEKEFGRNGLMVEKREKKYFLDLAQAVTKQLRPLGVHPKNIAISKLCTSCRNDRFFSFRREGQEVGGIMGVIGYKNAS